MAGRPRLYANSAEKNRAYRTRQEQTHVLVDRWVFEQTDTLLERLMLTAQDAQRRGHPLAASLNMRGRFDLLESLIRLLVAPEVVLSDEEV